jgi:hypothetical protein
MNGEPMTTLVSQLSFFFSQIVERVGSHFSHPLSLPLSSRPDTAPREECVDPFGGELGLAMFASLSGFSPRH